MSYRSHVRRLGAALLISSALSGCATAPGADGSTPNPREGQILTREHIARSGARDAWEAIQRGGTRLNIQYTREGSPARVTHRGVDSFQIDSQVLLVVDGAHMGSLSRLREIRAENVDYIQVLPARVGVVKYGTAGGNGVVVVRTGTPPAEGN
ncbi:MAG: TonB-dependent receptor plug domain-containing protein [Gemmatimonadota bacterium]